MKKTYQPADAANAEGIRFFSRYKPRVDAGDTFTVQVQQKAEHDPTGESIVASDAQRIHFVAEGPHERLAETDVVGRFPAPGSDSSPDEFLPHIALSRRTLPWERLRDANNASSTPWVALLVFKQSEIATPIASTAVGSLEARHPAFYQRLRKVGHGDQTQLDILWVAKKTLTQALPMRHELPLLCHVQRLDQPPPPPPDPDAPEELDPMWKLDDDACVAVVIANRLPDAGTGAKPPEEHVACLVSLEGRDDLAYPTLADRKPYKILQRTAVGAGAIHAMRAASAGPDVSMQPGVDVIDPDVIPVLELVPLVVLHSWRFTPSVEGDFEQVVKAIRYTPNGGVLRFGQTPREAGAIGTLTADGYLVLDNPAEPTKKAVYRGPLSAVSVPRRSGIALRAAPSELQDPEHPEKVDDYSYAAAFELGRLMTLADDGLLADLQSVRRMMVPPTLEEVLAVDPRPAAIAKKDWVVNPDPTAGNPNDIITLPSDKADFVGIDDYKAQVDVPQLVEDLAAIQVGIEIEQVIDIENIEIGQLDAKFAPVVTHAQAGRG